MIFVIDSDVLMAKCVKRAVKKLDKEVKVFSNVVEALGAMGLELPEMIFLEALLTGPDGFSFLNEMISYTDTAKVPIVMVTMLDLSAMDLKAYGVVGVLNKETMRPEEILKYVEKYAK